MTSFSPSDVATTVYWRTDIPETLDFITRSSGCNLLSELAQRPDFVISGIPLGNLGGAKALALIDTISQILGAGTRATPLS